MTSALAARLAPAVVTAALALASAPCASAQAPAPARVVAGRTTITLPDTAGYSRAQRRLLDLEIERSAAIARRDTAWLATLYAPDFRGVVASGTRVDRSALFRVFSLDDPRSRFLIDELEVRGFGAAATVTGRLRATNATGDVVGESRYLHVYVRRGGRWWMVAAEGTAIRPGAR